MKKISYVFLILLITRFIYADNPTPKTLTAKTNIKSTNNSILVSAIDDYCKTIDNRLKIDKGRWHYFLEVGETMGKDGEWKRFGSREEVNKNCGEGCYNSALVRKLNNKIVYCMYQYTSASGDWIIYTEYYFRQDGSVAKIYTDYRTFLAFVGDEDAFLARIETYSYYDSSNNLIKQTKPKVSKMKDKKLVEGAQYPKVEAPLFIKTKDLPFYQLIVK